MNLLHSRNPMEIESGEGNVPVDLEAVKFDFEDGWSDYRTNRTVLEGSGGERIVYETFQIPLFETKEHPYQNEMSMGDFMHHASVLGYRSTMGPILMPAISEKPVPGEKIGPVAIFCLSRTER